MTIRLRTLFNVSNISNVTSLTNAIVSLIAPNGDVNELSTAAKLASAASVVDVANATKLVVAALQADPLIAAKLGSGFNPLTTSFIANGTGIEAVLHQLEVSSGAGGVSMTNLAAPLDAADGSVSPQTKLVLTSAMVQAVANGASTSTLPQLPVSAASGTVPTVAEMNAIAKKFEACYALPIARRVTVNASGIATGVASVCDFAVSDWKSDRLNWVQNIGEYTLKRDIVTGAKVGTRPTECGCCNLSITTVHDRRSYGDL